MSAQEKRSGCVIIFTYSHPIGTYHQQVGSTFRHHILLDASKKNQTFIASGEIKNHVAAGYAVIIFTSITGTDVIKGLKKALEPVHNVTWWIHCGDVSDDLTTIDLIQGKSFVSKWHKTLSTLPNKVVPPSLAEDFLPPIINFKFLRFEPPPFEVLIAQIISTPVPPITKVSIVIMPSDTTCAWHGVNFYTYLGYEVHYVDGNCPEFSKKFWAKLAAYISVLSLFGKDYIIVCKPSHFGSYWEMRRSYENLHTPLGGGGFLVIDPNIKADDVDPRNILQNLYWLAEMNGSGAPNFTSASNLGVRKQSKMQEVD